VHHLRKLLGSSLAARALGLFAMVVGLPHRKGDSAVPAGERSQRKN